MSGSTNVVPVDISDSSTLDDVAMNRAVGDSDSVPVDSDPGPGDSATVAKTRTTIYVGNLKGKVLASTLRNMFAAHGTVTEVDVVKLSYAFVVMPEPSEAEAAIKALNGHVINKSPIIVAKKSGKPQTPKGAKGGKNNVQLFVGRCADISEEKLREVFEKFGEVVDVSKPVSKPGIGFVSMAHFFEAKKAVDALNRKPFDALSHVIFVQFSNNNTTQKGVPLLHLLELGETVKLFVGNLNETTSVKELGVLFEKYGPVYEAAIVKEKCFGFVHMLSRDSAQDAVRALNRIDFKGSQISVAFSKNPGKETSTGQEPGSRSMVPRQFPHSSQRLEPLPPMARFENPYVGMRFARPFPYMSRFMPYDPYFLFPFDHYSAQSRMDAAFQGQLKRGRSPPLWENRNVSPSRKRNYNRMPAMSVPPKKRV